ncbi:MAG TPA: glycosyltransferase family 39 protein, partial [Thermoflexales bacterium]|nr:glycosyltransferase family 39 protein [Thermoflexales bacterium]
KRAFLPFLLCLASFGLGVAGLSQRALWGDEAYSWWASQQSALALVGGLDAQPPLYHLLLGVQRVFGGDSEFSLRFLSVLCGVLGVAFVWRASSSARSASEQVRQTAPGATFVTTFVACAPIMVYFQQEARMYALAAMFSAAAISQTIILLNQPRAGWRGWLALALFSLGALFTHFYGVGILLVNALALLIHALRQKNARVMGQWLAAHLAIALVFGGWFFGLQWRYLGRAAGGRGRVFATPNEMLTNFQRGVNGLMLGLRAQPEMAFVGFLLFALALLGGVMLAQNRATRRWAALGFAWIIASFGLVLLTASPGAIVPDFNPRYLIFAITPLAILAGGWFIPARRVGHLGKAMPIAVAIMLGMGFVYGNILQYNPAWQKSGYRDLLQTLRQRAQPGDVAVLLNSDQYPHYAYYGPTGTPIWLMSNDLYAQPAQASAMLKEFLAQNAARRVWLVSYGNAATMQPLPQPAQDLNKLGARIYQQGFQDAALGLYVLLDGAGDLPATPLTAQFGNAIQLSGIRLRTPQVSAGDTLTFDLTWRAIAKPSADYTVFVHVLGAGGEQIAALDSPPRNGEKPTSTWAAGEGITETRGIPIPKNAKPGEYKIVVGLYAYPSFERLPVNGSAENEFAAGSFVVTEK